ncbi:MAG: helix-turn-helix transcriptional regulator [Candidatus Absconditabacterales bacterium]
MNAFVKHLGNAIESIRKEKGLRQFALAAKAGITQTYMCQIELGNKQAHMDTIIAICDALQVDIALLFLKASLESRAGSKNLTVAELETAMRMMEYGVYGHQLADTIK